MSIKRPLAVITGASSGLGEVFARQLAVRGFDLLLAARRTGRLEALAAELSSRHGIQAEPFQADLASGEDTERLAQRLSASPSLELLVNNAGFGTLGLFHETAYDRQVDMVKVHVLATMRLSRAALQVMVPSRRGGIINVSSVAAYFRSAQNASYCATKGWMNQFTEGLRLELDSIDSPVKVQALCPGFTYTEFHDTLGVSRDIIPKSLWMPAGFVVEESLRGLDAGKLFVVPGWRYRVGVALSALLPESWRLALERSSPHKRKKL